ncbi:hypothetical protein ACO0SA_001578 [Hanseniaspora valbyensis]
MSDFQKTPVLSNDIDSLLAVSDIKHSNIHQDETNDLISPHTATITTTTSHNDSVNSDFDNLESRNDEVLNIDPSFISKDISIEDNQNDWTTSNDVLEPASNIILSKNKSKKTKRKNKKNNNPYGSTLAEGEKPKRIRNKKACDVCRKKKIKCIYEINKKENNLNDKVDEMFNPSENKKDTSQMSINTIIPSNKQYYGIVCDHCKKNNLLCTFLAPERKRGNKKVESSNNETNVKNKSSSSSIAVKKNNSEPDINFLSSPDEKPKSTSEPADVAPVIKRKRKRRSKSEILRDKEIEESKKQKLNKFNKNLVRKTESIKELDPPAKLKKYENLFKAIFNNECNKNHDLNINNFNVDLFSKIYNNINLQKKTTLNYDFDGSSNNTMNNNFFQKSIDKYNYIISNNIPNDLNVFILQVPLPPKDIAINLIENAWLESFVVFRFYHRPSFIKNLHKVYSMPPHEYDETLIKFLPALYSVMAVGSLFSERNRKNAKSKKKTIRKNDVNSKNNDRVSENKKNYNNNTYDNCYSNKEDADDEEENENETNEEEEEDEEGYKYFLAARNMIDLSNCSDLHSIQTTIMLFMFLQCSARLSTCYIFIGIAMRSALREGYHRFIPEGTPGYTLLDIEMRKRTFFTIYKMDIYVNNMLGLPKAISSNDFDQQLPLEFEDEFITDEGLNIPDNYDPEKNITSVCISNHHTKLIMILEEVVDKLYPVKKTNNVIPHRTVTELEIKLDNWVKQLPKYLIPGLKEDQLPNEFLYKANRLLHFSFLQVQIVLYRPFIHYLIFNDNKHKGSVPQDELSVKRGEMCKKIAKQTITLAKEMMERNYLNGNHWFSIYTIFFSVAGLIFYVHETTPNENNLEEIKEYLECADLCKVAKQILDSLKGSSKAANRTYNVLNTLFDSLNKRTKMFMEMSFNKKQQRTTNTPSNGIFNKDDYEYNGANGNGSIGTNKYSNVNGDTPMSDFMSLFMSNNNGSNNDGFNFNDMPNYLTPSLAGEVANYSRFNNTPIGSSYAHLVSSDYPENKISSATTGNPVLATSQKFLPIATVSGSNLPLPVINEKSYNGDNLRQQQQTNVTTTPGFLSSFNNNNNKHNMLLDFNQENLFNNPAFDKHLSPMNIISDENAISAINNSNNSNNSNDSLNTSFMLKDNRAKTNSQDVTMSTNKQPTITTTAATPENETNKQQQHSQNNDTMYLSGVFDQLDMQLFGRYLPPYMTRNANTSTTTDNDSKTTALTETTNTNK